VRIHDRFVYPLGITSPTASSVLSACTSPATAAVCAVDCSPRRRGSEAVDLGCLLGHKLVLFSAWFCAGRPAVLGPMERIVVDPATSRRSKRSRLALELAALLLQTQMQRPGGDRAVRQQLVRAHLNYFFNFHVR